MKNKVSTSKRRVIEKRALADLPNIHEEADSKKEKLEQIEPFEHKVIELVRGDPEKRPE